MNKKIFILPIIITLIFIGYFFSKNALKNNKINFKDVSNQIEQQFTQPQLRDAAIGYAKTINEAIENPENAIKIQPKMAKSLSCLNAVLDELKSNNETVIHALDLSSNASGNVKIEDLDNKFIIVQKIRDLSVTNNKQRVKNYIRFNNNLNGEVFSVSIPKMSDCH